MARSPRHHTRARRGRWLLGAPLLRQADRDDRAARFSTERPGYRGRKPHMELSEAGAARPVALAVAAPAATSLAIFTVDRVADRPARCPSRRHRYRRPLAMSGGG